MTEQIVSLPFAQGIDEATRAELVDPGTGALAVLNSTQDKRGAQSKTLGYAALSLSRLSGSRSAGKRLFAHGSVPAVIDGRKLDLYVDAAGLSSTVDNVPPFTMQRDPVFAPKGGFDPDVVSATKTYSTAWYDFLVSGDIGIAVYTWTSGTTKTLEWFAWSVSSRVALASGVLSTGSVYGTAARGIPCRLVLIGNKVHALYEDSTANTIKRKDVSVTDATTVAAGFGSASNVVTNWNQADFDVCTDGTKIYLVYTQTGGNRLTCQRFDSSFASEQTSFAATAPAAAIVSVACDVANGALWCAWNETATGYVYVAIVNASNTAVALLATTTCLSAGASGGDIFHLGVRAYTDRIAWVSGTSDQYAAAGTREGLCCRKMTDNAGVWVKGDLRNWPSLGSVSQPWLLNDQMYLWAFWNASVLSTSGRYNGHRVTCAIALDEALPGDSTTLPVAPVVALPSPRLSCYAGASMGSTSDLPLHPGQRPYVSGNTSSMLLPRLTSSLSLVFDWVVLTENDPKCWDTEHMAQTSHLAAAIATKCDGVALTEIAYVGRPAIRGTVVAGPGLTGTFSYVALFESTDANGQVDWSAPSDPVSLTLANQIGRITYSSLAPTRRRNARVVLYRTLNGGQTYFRLTKIDNAPQASYGTFDDSTADATVGVNHRLYGMGALPTTAGASQPRQAPPGLRTLFRHGDRIVGIADDRATLWYSAPSVPGEGRWFSDIFQLPIESLRPLVGATSQAGTILAFTETEIWAISGDGPPDNGGNGTEFSTPQRITSDAGCIDERSLVTTSAGTFFRSSRGIELISTALSVDWVGERVATTLAAYPTVVSAVHDQARNVVMFECVNAAASAGITLVFDLGPRTWTTERRFESANLGAAAVDAMVTRLSGEERHHVLASNGTVYRRRLRTDGSAFLDTSTWRTMRASTAWHKVAGLAGYGQIKRLELMFDQTTAHDLSISFFYDDSATAEQTITRTAAEIAAAGGTLDIMPTRQKCRTFRVSIEDATPTNPGSYPVSTGEGSTLYALALAYDPIGGVDRKSSATR